MHTSMEDELEGIVEAVKDSNDVEVIKNKLIGFYKKAQSNTLTSATAIYQEKLYKKLTEIIVFLFVAFNAVVLTIVLLGFFVDLFFSDDVISGSFITPTVLVSLITATIAQTAAAFILIAKSALPNGD